MTTSIKLRRSLIIQRGALVALLSLVGSCHSIPFCEAVPEQCDSGTDTSGDGDAGSCGDGNVDPGEECDDGNSIDTDTCPSTCTLAI